MKEALALARADITGRSPVFRPLSARVVCVQSFSPPPSPLHRLGKPLAALGSKTDLSAHGLCRISGGCVLRRFLRSPSFLHCRRYPSSSCRGHSALRAAGALADDAGAGIPSTSRKAATACSMAQILVSTMSKSEPEVTTSLPSDLNCRPSRGLSE
jgi:hypothetical protein